MIFFLNSERKFRQRTRLVLTAFLSVEMGWHVVHFIQIILLPVRLGADISTVSVAVPEAIRLNLQPAFSEYLALTQQRN